MKTFFFDFLSKRSPSLSCISISPDLAASYFGLERSSTRFGARIWEPTGKEITRPSTCTYKSFGCKRRALS